MRINKMAAVIGVAAVALTGAGVGYAVWTNVTDPAVVNGTVDDNDNTLTLTTTGTLPTALGTQSDINVFASNVTQASQILTDLDATLSGTGCTVAYSTSAPVSPTTDFTVVDVTSIAAVPAVTNDVSQGKYTVYMNNLATNQDTCQGSALSFAVDGS